MPPELEESVMRTLGNAVARLTARLDQIEAARRPCPVCVARDVEDEHEIDLAMARLGIRIGEHRDD